MFITVQYNPLCALNVHVDKVCVCVCINAEMQTRGGEVISDLMRLRSVYGISWLVDLSVDYEPFGFHW